MQSNAVQRGDLTRNAQNRQAIGPVRGEFQRKYRVIKTERFPDRLSCRQALIELEQAGMIFRQPQLASRAQHAE